MTDESAQKCYCKDGCLFFRSSDADLIAKLFTFEKNPSVRIILTDDEPFDINSYLLPFAIVVGICFLIMLGIVIFKVPFYLVSDLLLFNQS